MIDGYVCPVSQQSLSFDKARLAMTAPQGISYPVINVGNGIPNFVMEDETGAGRELNLSIYDREHSVRRYQNELNWLYRTFGETEISFRQKLVGHLSIKQGQRILVTGCGLGSDIGPVLDAVGATGNVYAQDLAAEMVMASFEKIKSSGRLLFDNVYFSISDAQKLPFADNFFDGVLHFGGLNLFDDIKAAIYEMARVTKVGGRVVFGDESVAPWLRDTDYGRAAINNNSLWSVATPIDLLPPAAINVTQTWVLGNCFYLIGFDVSLEGPRMDMDVPHIGPRGGTMRTRYFGKLEGVSVDMKEAAISAAKREGVSLHEWLESAIKNKVNNS